MMKKGIFCVVVNHKINQSIADTAEYLIKIIPILTLCIFSEKIL